MQIELFTRAKKEFRNISALMLMHGILPYICLAVFSFLMRFLPLSFYGRYQITILLAYLIPMFLTTFMAGIGAVWLRPSFDGLSKKVKGMGKYLIFLLGLNFFCSITYSLIHAILSMIHGSIGSGIQTVFTGNILFDGLILLYIVLLGPFFEEILFRGIILRTLDQYHRVFAMLVSSMLFAMMHLNLQQGITTFFIGCFLGYVSLKENSMRIPILLHILNNLIALLMSVPILSILCLLGMFACFVGMVYLLYKYGNRISELFKQEYCTYRYGKMFFTRWTTILYIIFFVGVVMFL